jgi:hypothetical protein
MRAPGSLRSAAAAAALLALVACKKEPPRPAVPAPPAPAAFRPSDLAAATALDARLARVTLLASDLQAAAQEGDAHVRARATLEPRLALAVEDADRALAGVSHPHDRSAGERALAAARRWPRLAAALRTEPPGAGPAELRAAADELGRAVVDYRRARASFPVAAAPEGGAALAFTRARAELERAESEAGQRLPVAPRDQGHELDPAGRRLSARGAAGRAREAAARLEPPLRDPALRWVEAEARALDALQSLPTAGADRRGALAREYQEAKADALDALAEYQRVVAAR